MKKLLDAIPLPRLMLYLFALGLLPLAYLAYDYSTQSRRLQALSSEISEVELNGNLKRQKQAQNELVRLHYLASNHAYLSSALESLPLLQKEKVSLEKMVTNAPFTKSDALEKRLAFLTGNENRLSFSEESVQSGLGMQETIESTKQPVEVDLDDLKEILDRIEEKKENAPQLFITDLRLQKKKTYSDNEVYELSLKLFKREFLS